MQVVSSKERRRHGRVVGELGSTRGGTVHWSQELEGFDSDEGTTPEDKELDRPWMRDRPIGTPDQFISSIAMAFRRVQSAFSASNTFRLRVPVS